MRFSNPFLYLIDVVYGFLIKIGGNLESLFLLYMRITWGHQFMNAGWKKLMTIEKTAAFFATLHLSHPHFYAYAVGGFEFVGGICLFIGFASRLAAIPLIVIMLTALSTAHAPDISNFKFLFQPLSLVQQAPYPFLITALLAFIFGPGKISVDGWLKRWSEKRARY